MSVPYHWQNQEVPSNGTTVWIVRVGGPEPPFQATWNLTAKAYAPVIADCFSVVPGFAVLKWRHL